MEISLYNTLTGRKEALKPHGNNVGMYVCGVTPYDYAHVGNARPAVVFDVLFRFLNAQGLAVTYLRNFTDIDDKIIASMQKKGESLSEVSQKFIDAYHKDMRALNVLHAGEYGHSTLHEPRVTAHVDDIRAMIETLVAKGHAYAVPSGDVVYDVSSFKNYGALSGKVLEDLQAGARVGVNDEKRDPKDFILWKAAKEGEPFWPAPAVNGAKDGRPGWHIECSAMSKALLGNHFQIHGGGEDLKFPHHECEIAQSEGANGEKYVDIWMHNAFITVERQKMSKSLHNFTTVNQLLEKHEGVAIRVWILGTHYRKPVDLSETALQQAAKQAKKMISAWEKLPDGEAVEDATTADLLQKFNAALADDLNTQKAIGFVNQLVKHANGQMAENAPTLPTIKNALGQMLEVLGVMN